MVTSLLSARFYFLAPVCGFTAQPPLGVLYASYAHCRTLRSALAARARLAPTSRSLIAAFVCYGMAYLEVNQLVHATLRSENIYLTQDLMPVITDCGLARTYDYFQDDAQNDEVSWIAPEVLLTGAMNYTVDMYSFGVLLFEMWEGRRPFAHLTNLEYLVALKSGLLDTFDFEQTPSDWKLLIQTCAHANPDERPGFFELFQHFQVGNFVFAGTDRTMFRALVDQYPIQWLFRPESSPAQDLTLISGYEILSDPNHRQFEEYLQFLGITMGIEDIPGLCRIVARHVTGDVVDQKLVRFILSVVAAIAQRGGDFRKAVLGSEFFTKLHITTVEQADILLETLVPIFTTERALLTPSLFQSIASLFLFHPNEALNLFSQYVRATQDLHHPSFISLIQFYISLWSFFVESIYGDRFLRIIAFAYRGSKRIRKRLGPQIVAILNRFAVSSVNAGSATLFLNECSLSAGQGSIAPAEQLRLATTAESWERARSLFLRMPAAASVDIARALVARARASPDPGAWAVLLKYARTSEEHARAVLATGAWFDAGAFDNSFVLMLALFGHAALRPELARTREFFAALTEVTGRRVPALLHIVCSLLQRASADADYVAQASRSGLLALYVRASLESADASAVRFGLVVVDNFARIAWADEWGHAAAAVVDLMRRRPADFAEESIRVLSALSAYPAPAGYLKRAGLCDYFAGLLQYEKYAGDARFFLANAARA
jgi:hypothetical protein